MRSFPEVRSLSQKYGGFFSGDDAESGLGRKQGLEDGMVSDQLKRSPAHKGRPPRRVSMQGKERG